jgi:integrase
MPTAKLTRTFVKGLPQNVQRATTYFDSVLRGFGLKLFPSGTRSWVIEYRPVPGGRGTPKRRIVIGSLPSMAPDQARNAAASLLAKVRLGADPAAERSAARRAATIDALLAAFMDERIRPIRKARTTALYDGYISKHLSPQFGSHKAVALTRTEVLKLHRRVGKKHPVTANRLLTLLNSAFSHGVKAGILPAGFVSPAKGIDKYKEQSHERFLSMEELARLGDAIREAETPGVPWPPTDMSKPKAKHTPKRPENRSTKIGPHAAAALRLLLFTGARLREILDLKWEHVDLERCLLFLPDSKTGKKTIALGGAALAVLESLKRVGNYVIAGDDPDKPRADLKRPWGLVSKRAGLEGVRLHDLRHSFASVGAGSGMSLPLLGKLLGHTQAATTQRYAHLAADPLRRAADSISGKIAAAMGESGS